MQSVQFTHSRKIRALAEAGFYCVQPGIESINDHLLALMGKGSSAVQNIALLKYSRSCGIYPIWNMLYSMPGEERIDYEKTIELITLIQHLQPPTFASRIEFSRFARYGTNPEEYGLELTGGPFLDTCRQNQPFLTIQKKTSVNVLMNSSVRS